ncbi:hypothetical protein AKJ16_DCAP06833 [Drosera capensis]
MHQSSVATQQAYIFFNRYWLFEPRCSMHDIGGWYVETYGRDKKARTVPSARYWDGADADPPSEKRLHPAVYLLGLAYRTLDIESVMQTKPSVRQIVQGNVFKVINCRDDVFILLLVFSVGFSRRLQGFLIFVLPVHWLKLAAAMARHGKKMGMQVHPLFRTLPSRNILSFSGCVAVTTEDPEVFKLSSRN